MRGLDLFSGIGGISLALRPWVQTVAYCECEPYAQAVLLERMQDGTLDSAPIWTDVRTLNREILDTKIDIIFGGFPCQDISVAGKQQGISSGTRSGLFFDLMRLVRELTPKYIFLENVAAICSNWLDTVLREIAAAGYDARWCCVSAAEVGAPHKRDRWWLLAHPNGSRLQKERPEQQATGDIELGVVADASGERLQRQRIARGIQPQQSVSDALCYHEFPAGRGLFQYRYEPSRCIESRMGRNTHGISYRVDRIKALGNSVVPQAAQEAFVRLMSP